MGGTADRELDLAAPDGARDFLATRAGATDDEWLRVEKREPRRMGEAREEKGTKRIFEAPSNV
jgi:hypothetical protein